MYRYDFTEITNKKFNTFRFPKINSDERDFYIIAREGDRLDLLANEFYEDSNLWWLIADANNLGKGNLNVPAGKQIIIPFDTSLFNRLLTANEEK